MPYAVVIEKAEKNYSAYVPDPTRMCRDGGYLKAGIEFHIDGMREDGLPIPEPASKVDYVDVAAQPGAAPEHSYRRAR